MHIKTRIYINTEKASGQSRELHAGVCVCHAAADAVDGNVLKSDSAQAYLLLQPRCQEGSWYRHD